MHDARTNRAAGPRVTSFRFLPARISKDRLSRPMDLRPGIFVKTALGLRGIHHVIQEKHVVHLPGKNICYY
jgi:hypothetical protein